jgi:hypothetical protein
MDHLLPAFEHARHLGSTEPADVAQHDQATETQWTRLRDDRLFKPVRPASTTR